jgi:peptide chain release factor 1
MGISFLGTLDKLREEYREIENRLNDPVTLQNPHLLAQYSQRYHELQPVVTLYEEYRKLTEEMRKLKEWIPLEKDPQLLKMAQEEESHLRNRLLDLEKKLKISLLPKNPSDVKNAVLEIRAGTGGEEAALFARDIYRMYLKYAEKKGWKVEEVDRHESDLGGIKEVIAVIEGDSVYQRLKFESGVHRVQRVPQTESQGRIHTSACTVAVLPEAEEVEVNLDPKDLRIEYFRSSGPGGQHVNTTDSAVRITHIPTGIVVTSQDERSQHKNKARALRILRTKLKEMMEEKQAKERAEIRKSLVGSGDRSERIRTYNFPQNRVTDHRIGLTLYRLDQILEGDLEELILALLQAEEMKRLQAFE